MKIVLHQKSLIYPNIEWENLCHVIGLKWRGFLPVLTCRSLDGENRIDDHPLRGRIELHVSGEKTCIGRWKDGKYQPCPTNARVTRFPRCDACAEDIIPDQNCIFEPRCHGNSCHVEGHTGERVEFCARPHAVYIAFYLNNPKVGMTSGGRVEERLIEQGADAYFLVTETDDRLSAREIEKRLSRALHIRQSYSAGELLRMTHQTIRREFIEEHSRELAKEIKKEMDFSPGPLRHLRNYPISLPLRSVPRETSTAGLHMGDVIGVKGRFLYYNTGGISALNITELVSRKIHFNSL